MEEHLKTRPPKRVFDPERIVNLREKAITKICSDLLPEPLIQQIVLIGSSVKETFGEYDPPGFRGSLYSDFDFIVFVDDEYAIPSWLIREPDGKPFSDDRLNLAYRKTRYVDDIYDIEVFFITDSSFKDLNIRDEAERAGIPMSEGSTHRFKRVYSRDFIF